MIFKKKMRVNAKKPIGLFGKMTLKRMNGGAHEKLAGWGFDHIFLRGSEKAIDLGCGGGANVKRLLEKLPDGMVAGMDYSEISVAMSRELNKEEIEKGRCRIVQGNVMDIPMKDNSVDVVTAFETVYFWPDLKRGFEEVFRILKENGTFLITNEADGKHEESLKWTKDIEGMKIYTGDEMEALLREVGFTRISVDDDEAMDRICVVAEKRIN